MNEQEQHAPFNLAGPVFKPRPGWGGQLKNWIKSTFEPMPTIGILGLVGVLAIVHMAVKDLNLEAKPLAKSSESQEVKTGNAISETAIRGQGAIHLARQALETFLKDRSIQLSDEQRVYAEMELASLTGDPELQPGDTISFKLSDIANAINSARQLSQDQLKQLLPYIH
ncbi:MAG: hypothetical protein AAB667_01450 [Patescibacteria group bacterium]